MKRLLMLLLLCLLPICPALAEIPAEARALLESAHPGATMTVAAEDKGLVLAVMSRGDHHTLCAAEQLSTIWALTVDNPTALRQGALPSFLYEGGMSLFWTYHNVQRDDDVYTDRYHATRTANGWSDVDLIAMSQRTGAEYAFNWSDGAIHASYGRYDENGNLLGEVVGYPPCELPHLESRVNFASFDASAFPVKLDGTLLQGMTGTLCPGYTVVDGNITADTMQFVADKPDGSRVFVGCVRTKPDGWRVQESTPLWPGTGCDSFHSGRGELLLTPPGEGESYVTVSLEADGEWRLSFIGRRDWFQVSRYWITDEEGHRSYGRMLPTLSVSAMDWAALPATWAEAAALQQDFDGNEWAMVNNPDPADRLHLRETANRKSRSQGKYYNGTPVAIVGEQGEWVNVHVCGQTGWMMKKYLAFGSAMEGVASAQPVMYPVEDRAVPLADDVGFPLSSDIRGKTVIVLGMVEGKKYHVAIQGESVYGWVDWDDLKPGNG